MEGAGARRLSSELAAAFVDVLGDRLHALYAYGSAVDGSAIEGFSDFDVACFCNGRPTIDDSLALHRRLGDADPDPFSYIQVKYIDTSVPAAPTLVPGSFASVTGRLPDESAYVYDDASILAAAQGWLDVLPDLVRDDVETWSVSIGDARRRRHLRLIATRVKPATRSVVALAAGHPHGAAGLGRVTPVGAFGANWYELADLLSSVDATAGPLLAAFRNFLPAEQAGAVIEAAEIGLRLLTRLTPS